MGPNMYIQERMIAEHQQQMQQEMEQQRLVAQLSHNNSFGRHVVGQLGTLLVVLGTRLERVEHRPGIVS